MRLFLGLVVLAGCQRSPLSSPEAASEPVNQAPRILKLSTTWQEPNRQLELQVDALDPDGDPLSFRWDADAGVLSDSSARIAKWDLPDANGGGVVHLTVEDGRGGLAKTDYHWVLPYPERHRPQQQEAPSGERSVSQENTRGIWTVAGDGQATYSGDDGPALLASLDDPAGLAVDRQNRIYVIDSKNQRIRRFEAGGKIVPLELFEPSDLESGSPSQYGTLWMNTPYTIMMGQSADFYFTSYNAIFQVDSKLVVTRLAGGDSNNLTEGRALEVRLDNPRGMALDAEGNLFVADSLNLVVRRIDRSGTIRTVAGTGKLGHTGDSGPAKDARIGVPTDLAFDQEGNLLILDSYFDRVRRVDRNGIIHTIAGNGQDVSSGDGGRAELAGMNPEGIAVDRLGNLYIADTGNHRIRKVTKDQIISTVAGTGEPGFWGDGGDPSLAGLLYPTELAFDANGHLLILDVGNHRIRKVIF